MGDERSIDRESVTRILDEVRAGAPGAEGRLVELAYRQLRVMARARMRNERPGATLQPTELVHEALLKLGGGREMPLENRAHFFGAVANAMRQILVERARARQALKRGGDARRTAGGLEELAIEEPPAEDLLALDQALERLAQRDRRRADVVTLRYFGGLNVAETAAVLKVSPRSVERAWTEARAWLGREMSRDT